LATLDSSSTGSGRLACGAAGATSVRVEDELVIGSARLSNCCERAMPGRAVADRPFIVCCTTASSIAVGSSSSKPAPSSSSRGPVSAATSMSSAAVLSRISAVRLAMLRPARACT
jgi:hypothetical protein